MIHYSMHGVESDQLVKLMYEGQRHQEPTSWGGTSPILMACNFACMHGMDACMSGTTENGQQEPDTERGLLDAEMTQTVTGESFQTLELVATVCRVASSQRTSRRKHPHARTHRRSSPAVIVMLELGALEISD